MDNSKKIEFAIRILQNSKSLISDAEILAINNRARRAAFLALTALEEIQKIVLLMENVSISKIYNHEKKFKPFTDTANKFATKIAMWEIPSQISEHPVLSKYPEVLNQFHQLLKDEIVLKIKNEMNIPRLRTRLLYEDILFTNEDELQENDYKDKYLFFKDQVDKIHKLLSEETLKKEFTDLK